ncbi:PD-(D/E)XK nuclease family protein [Sporosarcina sp. resist]|uniref:PD-(D/E)XK nuclease family protein n=1 Tax=Sporosarcina sp. resist TaxID=2762563 RepID=UPI00164E8638|nr:PD-(D/E)XK nuclease family protein [Sporosarcina sp. resist]QNK89824.1 PD-(D/E)XK nuclease family protein [Sporosarcina sp. resist]
MIFSFSRLSLYTTCPYRFFKKHIEGYEEPATYPLALGKGVHKAVEDKINGVSHSEAILNGMIEAEFHPKVTMDEMSELVSYAPLTENMGETEIHFQLPLSDEDSAPMLQGYIDLVSPDGSTIVDWKTNRVSYDVRDNHQVGLYAWAVGQLKNQSVVEGSLYFLRFRRASKHVFNQADMDRSRQWALGVANEINFKREILDMLPEEAESLFLSTPSSHCRHCPFAIECYRNFSSY